MIDGGRKVERLEDEPEESCDGDGSADEVNSPVRRARTMVDVGSDVHDFPVPDAPTTQRLKGVGCRHHRGGRGACGREVGVDGKEEMVCELELIAVPVRSPPPPPLLPRASQSVLTIFFPFVLTLPAPLLIPIMLPGAANELTDGEATDGAAPRNGRWKPVRIAENELLGVPAPPPCGP